MRPLRLGTRRSPLALAQTDLVADALRERGVACEIVPMTTSGDEASPSGTPPVGRKERWVDAITEALREGAIDVAVHSAKDLPAADDDDVVIAAVPARADPRDVLVPREGADAEISAGTVVGTSSLRRRAQLLAGDPAPEVREIHGNVETRLRKLAEGEVDALVLAAAGLGRLEISPPGARPLGIEEMLPAPGQGALAVQCRLQARGVHAVLMDLNDRASLLALSAERELTRSLGGGCDLPLGAIAVVRRDSIRLAAVVASPDGSQVVRAAAEAEDPVRVARIVDRTLRERGAEPILEALRGP